MMNTLFAVFPALLLASADTAEQDKAFVTLANAYVARNAEQAAAAYDENAELVYRYDGIPEERYRGLSAIASSFTDFFASIDGQARLDLNFRVAKRDADSAIGIYRLRAGRDFESYGRFSVRFGPDGRFATDESSGATRSDFEETPGALLVRPDDNDLDRGYYGLLAGRYRLPDGCNLVITRSVVRMFVRNSCTQVWRGLNRTSGLEWTAGDRVLSSRVNATYRFNKVTDRPSESLTVTQNGKSQLAARISSYRTEDIVFHADDGTPLAGTLYIPDGAKASAAVALLHGSGPQDRDGYASIMAVLADEMAANGRVVLAYDKRGSGHSGGNGNRSGFDMLATDAAAAMSALRKRAEVDPDRIGLAGSSQAGWVVAQAIKAGAKPADVFLLGAAGTAMTVTEQNLYNTGVQMRCAGIKPDMARLALDQQRAFFAALRDPAKAAELDRKTAIARKHAVLNDWLFPDSQGLRDAGEAWFKILDPRFDPLPIWRGYTGKATFLFTTYDDATDSALAMKRLKALKVKSKLIPSAQHLGLVTGRLCDGELAERDRFSPELIAEIGRWARGI